MSRNGSGSYSLYTPGNPVVTGTTIDPTAFNNTMNDIASALTQSVSADGQTPITGNQPMANHKHTGVLDATARTEYCSAGQAQDNVFDWLTSVTGTDTITASAPISMAAYATGQCFRFTSTGANTGAVTLNINSIGAKAITKKGATALAAGDIAFGMTVEVIYDGTQFQLVNPAQDALLTALAAQTTAANNVQAYSGANTPTLLSTGTNSGNIPLVGTKSATTTLAGLVELATQAEAEAGTDNTVVMTPLTTAQAIAATAQIVTTSASSPYTPANGEHLYVAHGLASVPSVANIVLECVVADAGFSIGDKTSFPAQWNGTTIVPLTSYVDATNVGCKCSSLNKLVIYNKSTGAPATPTALAWKYYFEVIV